MVGRWLEFHIIDSGRSACWTRQAGTLGALLHEVPIPLKERVIMGLNRRLAPLCLGAIIKFICLRPRVLLSLEWPLTERLVICMVMSNTYEASYGSKTGVIWRFSSSMDGPYLIIYGSMQLSHAHHVFNHQWSSSHLTSYLFYLDRPQWRATELSAPYRDARLPDVHTPEDAQTPPLSHYFYSPCGSSPSRDVSAMHACYYCPQDITTDEHTCYGGLTVHCMLDGLMKGCDNGVCLVEYGKQQVWQLDWAPPCRPHDEW